MNRFYRLTVLMFYLRLPIINLLGVGLRGAFQKMKWAWPIGIEHSHNPLSDKAVRYQVGEERLAILREYALEFAYSIEEGVQYVAFLNEIDPEDLDWRMPEETRYEYLCGRVEGERCMIFSYQWFEALGAAKGYARKHGMTIEGGWGYE